MNDELDFERLTQKQMADMLGVTPRTLRGWEAFARDAQIPSGIGPFPRNRDGTYHGRGVICWMLLYRRKFPNAR